MIGCGSEFFIAPAGVGVVVPAGAAALVAAPAVPAAAAVGAGGVLVSRSSNLTSRTDVRTIISMDIHEKVKVLGQAAALDCEGPPLLTREERKAQFLDQSRIYVSHPERGQMPIMRTMQTSACERNCYYCPFQAGRNYQRVSFKPE